MREFTEAEIAAIEGQRTEESKCPRHALAGVWLAANPVEGVECIDRSDGLGPRLLNWPDGMEYPDFEAFESKIGAKQKAEEAQYEADIVALRKENTPTARLLLKLLGT